MTTPNTVVATLQPESPSLPTIHVVQQQRRLAKWALAYSIILLPAGSSYIEPTLAPPAITESLDTVYCHDVAREDISTAGTLLAELRDRINNKRTNPTATSPYASPEEIKRLAAQTAGLTISPAGTSTPEIIFNYPFSDTDPGTDLALQIALASFSVTESAQGTGTLYEQAVQTYYNTNPQELTHSTTETIFVVDKVTKTSNDEPDTISVSGVVFPKIDDSIITIARKPTDIPPSYVLSHENAHLIAYDLFDTDYGPCEFALINDAAIARGIDTSELHISKYASSDARGDYAEDYAETAARAFDPVELFAYIRKSVDDVPNNPIAAKLAVAMAINERIAPGYLIYTEIIFTQCLQQPLTCS